MIVGDNIFVMLLVEGFFMTFTSKALCDATKQTDVIVCLSVDTRKKVHDMVGRAVAAGGTTPRKSQDHGFMYQHGFHDLDGHLWEVIHMQASAASQA